MGLGGVVGWFKRNKVKVAAVGGAIAGFVGGKAGEVITELVKLLQ